MATLEEMIFYIFALVVLVGAVLIFIVYMTLFKGAKYIEKVGQDAEERHEELNKDKENYWK